MCRSVMRLTVLLAAVETDRPRALTSATFVQTALATTSTGGQVLLERVIQVRLATTAFLQAQEPKVRTGERRTREKQLRRMARVLNYRQAGAGVFDLGTGGDPSVLLPNGTTLLLGFTLLLLLGVLGEITRIMNGLGGHFLELLGPLCRRFGFLCKAACRHR